MIGKTVSHYKILDFGLAKLAPDVAADADASFHDFSYLFKNTNETQYLDDGCHFNETRTAILAEAIAEIVAGRH